MSFTGSVQSGDEDPAFKVSIRFRAFPITAIDDGDDAVEIVRKTVYVEVTEEFIRNRKEQLALTALIGNAMICIVLGIFINCSCGKKPQATRKKKVQQGTSFNEIEVTSKAFDSKEHTIG